VIALAVVMLCAWCLVGLVALAPVALRGDLVAVDDDAPRPLGQLGWSALDRWLDRTPLASVDGAAERAATFARICAFTEARAQRRGDFRAFVAPLAPVAPTVDCDATAPQALPVSRVVAAVTDSTLVSARVPAPVVELDPIVAGVDALIARIVACGAERSRVARMVRAATAIVVDASPVLPVTPPPAPTFDAAPSPRAVRAPSLPTWARRDVAAFVATLDEADRRLARSVLAWVMPDAIERNADRGITSRPRAHEVYAEWSESHPEDALLASVARAERMAARDDRSMLRELRAAHRAATRDSKLERALSRRESARCPDVTFSCAAMG
jgi:hypothetical protein